MRILKKAVFMILLVPIFIATLVLVLLFDGILGTKYYENSFIDRWDRLVTKTIRWYKR